MATEPTGGYEGYEEVDAEEAALPEQVRGVVAVGIATGVLPDGAPGRFVVLEARSESGERVLVGLDDEDIAAINRLAVEAAGPTA